MHLRELLPDSLARTVGASIVQKVHRDIDAVETGLPHKALKTGQSQLATVKTSHDDGYTHS
jgi:hypothetical protein